MWPAFLALTIIGLIIGNKGNRLMTSIDAGQKSVRGLDLHLSRSECVNRALSMAGGILLPVPPGAASDATPKPLQYRLGYGGKDPRKSSPGEISWDHVWACDCSGFICWAGGFDRHQAVRFAEFGGDINTDSIWDACERNKKNPRIGDWFGFVKSEDVIPGDFIVYPGHRADHPIGHCGVVTSINPIVITDCHGQHHGADHAVDSRGPELWLAAGGAYVRNYGASS